MSHQLNNELPDMGLSIAQNAKLDRLLDAWRQKHELAPRMVEQVRQNAIAHSALAHTHTEELSGDWWMRFGGLMNSVLANTNQLQQQIADTWMCEARQWMPGWAEPSYGQDYLRPSTA